MEFSTSNYHSDKTGNLANAFHGEIVRRFFPVIIVSFIGIFLAVFASYLLNNMLEVRVQKEFEHAASNFLQGLRSRISETLLLDPSAENIKSDEDFLDFVKKQESLIPVEGIESLLMKENELQESLDQAKENKLFTYQDRFVLGNSNESWVFLATPKHGYYAVPRWIVFILLSAILLMTTGISFYLTTLIKNREKDILIMLEKDNLNKQLEALFLEASEAKFMADKANIAKSEFLSNMSHELRTPMHAILSYSDLGLKNISIGPSIDPTKMTKYLNNIQTSGNRLMILLNSLLDLSKLESGKHEFNFQGTDFKDVIEHSLTELESLIQNKHLSVHTQYSQNTHAAFDKNAMIQVIVNILSNAIKFSPENTSIKISVENAKLSPQSEDNSALLCCIEDEGVGIPPDELKEVFDKFIQSSKTKSGAGGTGLGLSICKQIIEAHGGSIWAENGSERGTIFKFLISTKPPSMNGWQAF